MSRGREQFDKYKKILVFCDKAIRIFNPNQRRRLFENSIYIKGKLGLGIRYVLFKSLAKSCGDNVAIFENVWIFNPQNISIGNNVSIHPMSYIQPGDQDGVGITIGSDVSIAHGVTIIAESHNYKSKDMPIKDQGYNVESIVIESDVWIGSKATVLKDVTISSGCVIGASSVVTKSTEVNGVYVGIPAKIIKYR